MRLERAKFAGWLAAMPLGEIVGNRRDCCSCPIATFYCKASGGFEVSIFDDPNFGGHVIDRGYSRRKLPDWASAFVFLIDRNNDDKITAGRALEVLNDIY